MLRIVTLALVVSLAARSTAIAQHEPAGAYAIGQFGLPCELTQGLITDRGYPLPYTASGRCYPTFVLDSHGKWRTGASLAVSYRNPQGEFMVGPRISYRLLEVRPLDIEGLGVDLALEGLFGTNGGDELALEALADVGGRFRLGIRAARDYSRGEYLLEGVVGTDPFSWFRSPQEDP